MSEDRQVTGTLDIWDALSRVYNMPDVPDEAKSIIGDVMLELSSVQPDLQPTCNQLATDTISRQDAYDTLTDYYHHTTQTQHDALRDALGRVSSVEPEPKWIPVSERLPDEIGLYLVTVRAEFRPVRIYGFSPWDLDEMKKYWINDCNDHSHVFNHFVKAWMPLPEPYRGDEP